MMKNKYAVNKTIGRYAWEQPQITLPVAINKANSSCHSAQGNNNARMAKRLRRPTANRVFVSSSLTARSKSLVAQTCGLSNNKLCNHRARAAAAFALCNLPYACYTETVDWDAPPKAENPTLLEGNR